jgi:hypothetical protein
MIRVDSPTEGPGKGAGLTISTTNVTCWRSGKQATFAGELGNPDVLLVKENGPKAPSCLAVQPWLKANGYSMLCNSASAEIGLRGRIWAGPLPGKHRDRSSSLPKAGRRAHFGDFRVAVQPKSGPEVRIPPRRRYCAT